MKTVGVGVGVGVGVPLGLLLIAGIVGVVWWMRRMERRMIEREQTIKVDVIKAVELQGVTNVYEMQSEKNHREFEMPC